MASGKKKKSAGGQPPYEGPERRRAEITDRRQNPRGGRRAGDVIKRVATFAYKLLTEPPR